ncbi:MAG: transporter [Oscillospiraceae bacterium]|nr:transporter [Oscillospiraceae bacterium]
MKKLNLKSLEKFAKSFEIVIALLLLVVIAIKIFETIFMLIGFDIIIISMDFERILSMAFALVIGVEFTKMLFKLTPETIIDVLLFAIARQTVIYHETTLDLLVGVLAIAVLYAAKKYLVNYAEFKQTPKGEQKDGQSDK